MTTMEIQGWALMILILQCYTRSSYSQSSSVFQCQSSSDQSGLVYTPNIPDFYFNHTNVADLLINGSIKKPPLRMMEEKATHIFTIPPESAFRNCSGSLVSIQYCYRARDSENNVTIFILSSLVSLNQQGLFEVINITTIQTAPRNGICTDIDPSARRVQLICCDTTPLSGLQMPSSEYVFGVTMTTPETARILNFLNEYRVTETTAMLGNTGPPQGSMFTLNKANSQKRNSHPLLLLKFLIEPGLQENTTKATFQRITVYKTDASNTPRPNSLVKVLTGIVGPTLAIFVFVLALPAIRTGIVTLLRRRRDKRNLNNQQTDNTCPSTDTITTSHVPVNVNEARGQVNTTTHLDTNQDGSLNSEDYIPNEPLSMQDDYVDIIPYNVVSHVPLNGVSHAPLNGVSHAPLNGVSHAPLNVVSHASLNGVSACRPFP